MPTVRKYASAAERQAAYRRRCAARRQEQMHSSPSTPSPKRWKTMMAQALRILETATREMESYHDKRSERWQEGERGEQFREMTESLEEITAALREI
jgi:hypothetical protein